MSTDYPIEDKVYAQTAHSFNINSVMVVPFTTCSWRANMLGKNGELITVESLEMTKEEYDAWGNDDEYLVNLTYQKLGVVPKPSS